MDERATGTVRATLKGVEGEIVAASENGLHWQVEVPADELAQLVARFATGEDMPVMTDKGALTVRTRDWLIWPSDDTVRVRFALEDVTTW